MVRRLLLLLVLLCGSLAAPAFAQLGNSGAVKISGLSPTRPEGFRLVYIEGMSAGDLAKAKIGIDPPNPNILSAPWIVPAPLDKTELVTAVWFVAVMRDATAGKYDFVVSLNPFRPHLEAAAANPLGMEPADAKRLADLNAELSKKYTYWSASAVLEVSGGVPFPPTPIPPGPSRGLVTTIVIRIVDTLTSDQSEVLSNLRQWSDQQPKDKLSHLEFPPDAKDPSGSLDAKVAAWVAKIPSTAKQPFVFITQPGADGKNVVVWSGELPKTADELIAKIKERM